MEQCVPELLCYWFEAATGNCTLFMIRKSRVKRQQACQRHAYLNYCSKSELNISPFTSHHYYYYLTFSPLLSIATCVWKAHKMWAFCVGYFLFSFSVSSWMTQKYYEWLPATVLVTCCLTSWSWVPAYNNTSDYETRSEEFWIRQTAARNSGSRKYFNPNLLLAWLLFLEACPLWISHGRMM